MIVHHLVSQIDLGRRGIGSSTRRSPARQTHSLIVR
jgi:hypothetical protein